MVGRWLVRLVLAAVAFLSGSFATGLALGLVTWDQSLVDLFGILGGVGLAALTFIKTRPITHPGPH